LQPKKNDWQGFVNHAGPDIAISTDGLWQPLTDHRIKAVMSIAPEGFCLFGERGLATEDRPTMIIAGTDEDIHSYVLEAVNIFDNLGISDKTMIAFVEIGRKMLFSDEEISSMKHFTVAFLDITFKTRKIPQNISLKNLSHISMIVPGEYIIDEQKEPSPAQQHT
jgi:hypothetical protein